MRFAIVTDSSCNLPDDTILEYGLHILTLSYRVGGKEYQSYIPGVKTDLPSFYQMLRSKELVTTSLVSPTLCAEMFEKLLSEGQDVLYIGFSSGLSGTFQVASNTLSELAQQYPERKCLAIDSLAASLGQGLLVHYAVQLRDTGKSIDEVYEWLLQNRLHLAHWFTVDDLFFLKRGGRVSASAALFGTMLSIKPVMHVDNDGHLIPVAKVRGRKNALIALCDRMEQSAIDPANQTVFISHGDCLEDAEYLMELIRQRLGVQNFLINYVDSVIGAHSGPGTVALFFLADKR